MCVNGIMKLFVCVCVASTNKPVVCVQRMDRRRMRDSSKSSRVLNVFVSWLLRQVAVHSVLFFFCVCKARCDSQMAVGGNYLTAVLIDPGS